MEEHLGGLGRLNEKDNTSRLLDTVCRLTFPIDNSTHTMVINVIEQRKARQLAKVNANASRITSRMALLSRCASVRFRA